MLENGKYIMDTYKRYNICLTEGNGCKVKDSTGKEYLDFVGGIAVMSLGHGNQKVVNAIKNQADKLMQCSNLFWSEPQADLAKLLVENSVAEKAFFCNSGAEANETAIKLARKHGTSKYGNEKHKIITMKNSFHGRTMATIAATGQEKFHAGFYPLLSGFVYVPFNDCSALEEAFDDTVCAVMIEPVQGEGGLVEATGEFMDAASNLCSKHDALLIFDEIQCGLGRTGKLFAYEHYDVAPDVITLSKALGGGVPMGCCLVGEKASDTFVPGDHGSTFGGNPLAAAAGLAAFEELLEQGLAANAEKMGLSFFNKLSTLKESNEKITEIRGKGLMLGLVLNEESAPYIDKCHELGLLVCSAGPNIMRFLPPLTVDENALEEATSILKLVFEN